VRPLLRGRKGPTRPIRERAVCLAALLLGLAASAQAQSGAYSKINQYPIPTESAFPNGITAGPDAALWFTESQANQIGRIATTGAITEYTVPTPHSYPFDIAAGPDGALWFTELAGNQIGRITTTGVIAEYAVPTPNSYPKGITAGPDSALWFTEEEGPSIGRITTAGIITEYPLTGLTGYIQYITAGPDGALWITFLGNEHSFVLRMTTDGVITAYPVPVPIAYSPQEITAGPDGALWFADDDGAIWRITTEGGLTRYPVPLRPSGGGTGPITSGPDGALWFTVTCNPCAHDWVGRITTTGVITEFPAPTDGSLNGIATGPDGALWITREAFFPRSGSGIWRIPACGPGFSASFSGSTLTMNFNLGIDTPATFNILLYSSAGVSRPFSRAIPAVVPPQSFTMNWTLPDLGSVTVQPVLTAGPGGAICSQWTTVDTAQ